MVSFISLHLTLQKCLLFMEIWTSCWKYSKFFFPADCVTDWEKKHLFHVFTRLNIQHHIPIIDLQVIHFFVTRYSGQVEIYLGFFKCVVTVFGCFFREQYDREQALDDFKTGKAKILIATDVASRGLDIRGVT